MSRKRVEFVVAGGGTSGHVLPALAVGQALVARGHEQAAVAFVGTRRGIEGQLVPAAGFRLVRLPGRGIVRRLSARNLTSVAALSVAFVIAVGLLARWRPRVVVSVGGFGALAGSCAARLLRIPVVVVNVDAVPGAANRLIGRFAASAAVAFPGTKLPRAVVTGAPVRADVLDFDRSETGRARARAALGLEPGRLVLAVVGGSLGARRLNETALTLAERLASRADLVLYHVSGERELATWSARAASLGLSAGALDYRLVGYEHRLPALFAAADLVVCRAGASTVAELCVIGTPAVLVPLPKAPSDHQRENANRLAAAGAAIVVEDDDATAERVLELTTSLLADSERRAGMAEAACGLGRPDAARRVAALVEEVGARPTRIARPGAGSARDPEEDR